ncbi:hypothetical protein ACFSMW_06615 [Virgibacillus halophilus]|uniref:Phage head-tail joining protein n=1 Tax=Tigheibacillus halophilus TaxID=361280 RepID=A0ABU5C639_9BACI|nr:hypothetical protein [Virgibacillus halophilus]
MRFSDRIAFVNEGEPYYDPVKGEYVEGEPTTDIKPCKLSTMGVDRTNELFGQIDRVVTIARLQHPYNKEFDYVLIKEQKYNVKRQSDYRKGVFYLEGVSS